MIGQEGITYQAGNLLFKVNNNFTEIDNSEEITITDKQWFNSLAINYNIRQLKPIFTSAEGDMALYYYIEFDTSNTVEQVKYSFMNEPEVEMAWVNHLGEAFGEDQYYNQQWALNNIQAYDAWQITSGKSNVIIALIDLGIDLGDDPSDPMSHHPDLRYHLWNGNGLYGINTLDLTGYPTPDPSVEHGTITAGVAAAATWNDIGIAGLAGGGFNNESGILIMEVRINIFVGNTISDAIYSHK